MQLTKAVNIISKSAMSNSSKPHKFAHLQKLDHQSMLYGAHVKKNGKDIYTWFYERMFDEQRNKPIKKKVTVW